MTATLAPLTTDAVLDAAADLVADRGFHQLGLGPAGGPYSLEGAIYAALGFHAGNFDLHNPAATDGLHRWELANRAFRAIAEYLGELRPSRAYGTVCDWSEHGDTDRAAALLGRVAARHRAAREADTP